MRYLAIDHGIKRTGLAICDEGESISSPLAVLHGLSDEQIVKKIVEIIERENIEGLVLGMPYNMDGTEGGQAKVVNKFAERLKKNTELPVNFQDERLSSFAAKEKLSPAEFTRKKMKERLDAVAAAHILDAFLEQKNKNGNIS